MRKLLIAILLAIPIAALGSTPKSATSRHLVRVGWGDMLFESLAFPSAGRDRGGKGYTGHLFGEYQYQWTKVVSVGAQLDFQGIFTPDMNNYDLTFLPTVRFTYLRTRMVQMYSGVGAGLLFAFDNCGGAELAPALNLNLVGLMLGDGPLTIGFELGLLNALTGAQKVYMAGSRLFSLSLNYQF